MPKPIRRLPPLRALEAFMRTVRRIGAQHQQAHARIGDAENIQPERHAADQSDKQDKRHHTGNMMCPGAHDDLVPRKHHPDFGSHETDHRDHRPDQQPAQ